MTNTIRRRLLGLLAALGVVLTLAAVPASGATTGARWGSLAPAFGADGPSAQAVQRSSCVSGGTTVSFSMGFEYTTNGGQRTLYIRDWSMSTSPAAKLDRITLYARGDNGFPADLIAFAGGLSSTQNDVPSSWGPQWLGTTVYPDSGPSNDIYVKFGAYGGVGDSSDSCSSGWIRMVS